MLRFFVVVIFVYVCMNFYFYAKLRAIISLSTLFDTVLLYGILFLVLAPFIVHSNVVKLLHIEQVMAYIGYCWLAFVFLFCCVGLVLEVLRLLIYLASFGYHHLQSILPSAQILFFVPFILAGSGCIYGYFAGQHIHTDTINITSNKIKQKITIMQISDVHLDSVLAGKHLQRILNIVRAEKPDVLISTGDLIDPGAEKYLQNFQQQLQTIKPLYGKYAVTGNHEYYFGIDRAVAFTEGAGFKMLQENTANIADEIVLVGVDDPAGGTALNNVETTLLAQIPRDKFIILLKHQPVIQPNSLPLFDLQLSGHTHRGQIFPFVYVVRLLYPFTEGRLYDFNGHRLYVSQGAGMWGPPIRLFAPPQVTVINLLPKH